MIKDKLKTEIEEYAKSCLPLEACGFVVKTKKSKDPIFIGCSNKSKNKDNFVISAEDFVAASKRGEILYIIHSHPYVAPTPSQADRVSCERSGLPWFILSVPNIEWSYLAPEGYEAPLIGRIFCHGVLDCYSIIKDWYKQEKGIELIDFNRSDNWWKDGLNLYVENFAKAGFKRVEKSQIEIGDVILMQIGSKVPNHGAVYIGNDMMLHHLYGKLSCRAIWGGYYRKHTTHILRYNG